MSKTVQALPVGVSRKQIWSVCVDCLFASSVASELPACGKRPNPFDSKKENPCESCYSYIIIMMITIGLLYTIIMTLSSTQAYVIICMYKSNKIGLATRNIIKQWLDRFSRSLIGCISPRIAD